MNKINKKSIAFTFGVLTLGMLGLFILPMKVFADIPGYVTPYNSTNWNNTPIQNNSYIVPSYPPNYPTPPIYQNNPNEYEYVNPSPINNTTNNSTTEINTTTKNSSTTENENKYSDLAANAIFGADGFLPSGLIQWVLLAIIILLIVIFVRKFSGAEKNYHEAPLKHA